MRDLRNLERLLKLKNEAKNINSEIESENRKLSNKRNALVENAIEDFIKDLVWAISRLIHVIDWLLSPSSCRPWISFVLSIDVNT